MRTRSDDAAESGTALVSSMMEPIALTQSSPDALGAGRPVGLRLLNRNAQGLARRIRPALPRTTFRGPYLLVGFWPEAAVPKCLLSRRC
jgi:hypothetical protein